MEVGIIKLCWIVSIFLLNLVQCNIYKHFVNCIETKVYFITSFNHLHTNSSYGLLGSSGCGWVRHVTNLILWYWNYIRVIKNLSVYWLICLGKRLYSLVSLGCTSLTMGTFYYLGRRSMAWLDKSWDSCHRLVVIKSGIVKFV